MRARAERKGYKNGTKYGSLTSQVKYDPRVQPFLKTPCAADSWSDTMESKGVSGYAEKHRGLLLPTPNACDYNTTWSEEAKERCLKRRAEEGKTAYPGKFNVLKQMAVEGLLPTPTARDEKNPSSPDGERIARKKEQGWTIELNDLAAMDMLPTPIARCWKGGSAAERKDTGKVRTDQLDTFVETQMSPAQDGKGFRLSPLFTEEMMGFPLMWTTLPFLSANGAPKPSKPTATPSSRK